MASLTVSPSISANINWTEIDRNRYKTWYNGAGIIIFNENKVLLVQDANTKKWSFPKGHAEKCDCDMPLLTAIRETMEEVGLNPITDYVFNSFVPIQMRYSSMYYIATMLDTANPPKINGVNECAYQWCSRDQIIETMWNDVNTYVKQYISNFW